MITEIVTAPRRMPHIVFAIFVVTVAFVHLAKGQTCASAQDNLDFRCVTELLNTANPSVCSGSCDIELAALRTACRNSVSLIII